MPAARERPAPDDHLVVPETREELVRGERVLALPALPAHGDGHSKLDAVISHHLVPGYVPSIDLLTRFDEGSDFASDVCIRKAGTDAAGKRHLEEVAFEVVAEQTRRNVSIRADEMTKRGVRRVLAIFTDEQTVEEWQPDAQRWQVLDPDSSLHDPTFVRPLLVRALLDAALGLNEVVKAAELKGAPRVAEIRREGEQKGKRELIESFAALQGIAISAAQRRTLHQLDAQQLDALFRRLVSERRWPE
jgi:hypothetical protein